MRVDLHIHTCASPDSLSKPEQITNWAVRRGLNVLAITDHNTITMARAMAVCSELPIIIGEEISTREGELIGLFLRECVPPGESALDTAQRIHKQGGIVMLPHPYDSLRHSALGPDITPALMDLVDIVEVLNARVIRHSENKLAEDLARHYGKLAGAGSDAHLVREVGSAYLEMPPFGGRDAFLSALAQARACGRPSSPIVHAASTLARTRKRLQGIARA
ncbi:MAG: PHP domain-containing protein [Chloroflexi bacterium]|nr:PHP domain-containing protein [Chloroflexota bacterium]